MPEAEDREMEKKLNPQIHVVEIGKRNLRKIEIYPLSLGDQFKISDLFSEVVVSFFEQVGTDPEISPEVVSAFFGLFKKHFPVIISLVSPDEKPDKLIQDMTNTQFSEIAEIVWKDNFEGPVKKLKGLFIQQLQKESDEIPSELERPLPASVDTTDTPSGSAIN